MRSKPEAGLARLDVEKIRAMFPVLKREIKPGVPLVYLDSAATSQRPQVVIDTVSDFYAQQNANIHRGIHQLAEEATERFEAARGRIGAFIGAGSNREVIFTRNTTEAINLVAQSWGRANLGADDLVVLTEMEHHSNIVPWQMLAPALGFEIAYVSITDEGTIDMQAFRAALARKPKLVGFVHMSNMLGTINPVQEMTALAHDAGALVLIDGAQAVPHMSVDVNSIGADFYVFSGHKMCAPTGVGVLYGREALLEEMPPFLGGGDMIKRVELSGFSTNELPYKFEAGTPAIAQAIGMGTAVEFLDSVGMQAIHAYERGLINYALERLEEVPGVRVYGPTDERKGGVASFTFDSAHPHDVAEILNDQGIAVRAGHHCAMPAHQKFGLPATTRASFYLYNTTGEIDLLIEGLYRVKEIFG